MASTIRCTSFISTIAARSSARERAWQACFRRLRRRHAGVHCNVTINGKRLGEYRGGYTPFSFELTEPSQSLRRQSAFSGRRTSTERKDIPPFGSEVDYLTFGGIYREVALRIVPQVFIENIPRENEGRSYVEPLRRRRGLSRPLRGVANPGALSVLAEFARRRSRHRSRCGRITTSGEAFPKSCRRRSGYRREGLRPCARCSVSRGDTLRLQQSD